ncbi:hypothetical protein [Knoellia sp. Soil729]|uniref:hypothetical protein n=1 Tax=Knoellia sp. Soil729 TaxID=1736394 RepID=UPI0007000127|nr:hypothetical protein [Knoellia sp. Soil729]KRE41244.1 hypothetical protein ASG74_11750 [Knoellia sp. Soil729]
MLAQLAGGVVHLIVEAIGYRVPALDSTMSDAEAETRVQQRWQSSMMLHLALIEAIAIGSLVVPCALEGGLLTYAVGAAVPLTIMAMHVWPWSRPVSTVAQALEAEGRASHLPEMFGLTPREPSSSTEAQCHVRPIQE